MPIHSQLVPESIELEEDFIIIPRTLELEDDFDTEIDVLLRIVIRKTGRLLQKFTYKERIHLKMLRVMNHLPNTCLRTCLVKGYPLPCLSDPRNTLHYRPGRYIT